MATSRTPTPPEQDAKQGTYAMCVDSNPNVLFRYENISKFRSAMEWNKRDEFDKDSVPPTDLVGAEFTQDDAGHTWVLARDIEPEGEVRTDRDEAEEEGSTREQGRYVIHFGGGEVATGNTQADGMADAVRVMIQSYGLLDEIDLPYGSGYKNALLNDRPEHPDGREMERPAEVTGGYYFTTKLSKEQKIDHLEVLAKKCGAEIEFDGEW